MKKTRKKVLGIVGLAFVIVMTVLAVLLPDSGASALETNPISDEVTVRVVGSAPLVEIIYPENGSILVDPTQYLQFSYENVATTTAEIRYTDPDGVEHIYTLDTVDPDYVTGTSEEYVLDLLDERYGYGDYVITVRGVGFDGVTAEDTIAFSFCPVYGDVSESEQKGTFRLDLFYDSEGEDLAYININVYDSEGNIVPELSPTRVNVPGTEVDLFFAENNLPFGDYTIEIIGMDSEGKELSRPYYLTLEYKEDKKDDGGEEDKAVAVPDTGFFWGGTGISNTDITITGLVVFLATAAVAVVLVARVKKTA